MAAKLSAHRTRQNAPQGVATTARERDARNVRTRHKRLWGGGSSYENQRNAHRPRSREEIASRFFRPADARKVDGDRSTISALPR